MRNIVIQTEAIIPNWVMGLTEALGARFKFTPGEEYCHPNRRMNPNWVMGLAEALGARLKFTPGEEYCHPNRSMNTQLGDGVDGGIGGQMAIHTR